MNTGEHFENLHEEVLLVIDDTPDNILSIEAALSLILPEIRVVSAASGEEGILLARTLDPVVILLDILMPGMDGYETCRRLKADPATRHIPVVYLSALDSDRDTRVPALRSGAEFFFTRPIEPAELAQTLATLRIRKKEALRLASEKESLARLVQEQTGVAFEERLARELAEAERSASEARYRAIFECMPTGCCYDELVYEDGVLVDYRILDVNAAFCEILGFDASRVKGSLASVLYGMQPPPNLDIFARVAATGKSQSFEAWFEPAKKYLHLSVGSPGPGFFSTVFSDITETRQLHAAVKESRENLAMAQRVAKVGSWIWHVGTGCLEWSDEMFSIFSVEQEGFDGNLSRVIRARVHPDDQQAVFAAQESVEIQKLPKPLDYRVLQSDGSIRYVHAEAGQLVLDADGRPQALSGIVQDITERVQAERQIRALAATLEERVRERTAQLELANRELEAFANAVSHDLKAPLRALGGFGELLAARYGSLLDEEGMHFLDRIRESSSKMSTLVEDLLKLSRYSGTALHRERIDLSAMAAGSSAAIAETAGSVPVEWCIEQGMVVLADPHLLRVVLDNLLGNACKYSKKVPHPRVRIFIDHTGELPAVCVSDNGVGFDMTYADQLFLPFRRLHSEREFPGTGIGLSTVKRIVERHGGTVWATGISGNGAQFFFTMGEGNILESV